MQRRAFVQSFIAAFLEVSLSLRSHGAATKRTKSASLSLGTVPSATMPEDFVGLSFEMPQLYNPDYYTASNTSLVLAYRNLSGKGVLRAGGHLSDVTRWAGPNGGFSTPKEEAGIENGKKYWEWKLTDPSVRDTRNGAITPAAIQNLRGFLDATNWRLIYGLNFGCGSIERAVDEASYVAGAMGDRLIAFQLGNEDDQFGWMPAFRAKGFNFEEYFADYQVFMKAIRHAVPNARFGGPDVATNTDWVRAFAESPDNNADFLSSHFYAMGPADDPSMDAAFLLSRNARLARQISQIHRIMALSHRFPYRITEANSCFGGGKPGVSNAYVSALWGADYLLTCANAGLAGVNLHGGGDGFYTPIAVGPNLSTERRPLYHGIQFASQFSGFEMYDCQIDKSSNLSVYFGKRGTQANLALINKDNEDIVVNLPSLLSQHKVKTEMRMTGPSLNALSGINLAEHKSDVHTSVTVPAYSAVILKWN
jgi:hypothetical protein